LRRAEFIDARLPAIGHGDEVFVSPESVLQRPQQQRIIIHNQKVQPLERSRFYAANGWATRCRHGEDQSHRGTGAWLAVHA
jgi:hypothetical protein